MLSISSGHSAEYLTGQVAQGRENYYLDATTAGEPPGRWWGSGAEAFGLRGEVDNAVMTALYTHFLDPRDPKFADPSTRHEAAHLGRAPGRYKSVEQIVAERLADEPGALPERVREIQLEAQRAARQPVMFIDATFSPVKSFTVLHTALQRAELDAERAGDDHARTVWAGMRAEAEASLWAGNNSMLSTLSTRAGFSRVGRHGAGAGRWTDAHDWTVASFHQSDSRDHDPQQHIHNAILNRVVCPDGEVRTLDSRSIHEWKQAAGGIGERVMEEELSRRLGVRWEMRPDGNGREIVGIDRAVTDLFSERSAHISRKLQVQAEAFEAHYGRAPNALELSRMRQQTALGSRRAKEHAGETHGARLDRWDQELRAEVAGGLGRVAEQLRDDAARGPVQAEKFSPSGILEEAIAACQEKRPAFSRSELERQIAVRLPHLGGLSAEGVTTMVTGLADQGVEQLVPVSGRQPTGHELPAELTVSNGSSVYAVPGGPKYATKGHVIAEQALRRATVERGRASASAFAVDRWMRRYGQDLGADQEAAARGLFTSGAAVSVLVGPAGTGKSFTVAALSRGWGELIGGKVVGLATSQIATEVLVEDGVTALNTARWLAAQRRLEAGTASAHDDQWILGRVDAIVVDESSMVDTAVLSEIRRRVDDAGARLILTGDPRQLAAVGAGGAMEMLAADHGADVHTLTEVRRFTNEWERSASLHLRDGEQAALREYDRRGRIFDGGTAENARLLAARAYLGDVLDGRSSLVIVPTNQAAAAMSGLIRDELVALGRVEASGVLLAREGNTAGVGDLVQARRNEWDMGAVNRRRYVVEEVGSDGGMRVRTEDGARELHLPPAYVQEHLVLGYASTAHSAQGVTVDSGHLVTAAQTTTEGLYVGLSRGRESNTAYVVTIAERDDEQTGETHARDRQEPLAVLADVLDREDTIERAALEQAAEDARNSGSMHTIEAHREDGVRQVTRMRLESQLDHLAEDGTLNAVAREALAADQGTEQLSRLLRAVEQAGHDPAEALRDAVSVRSFDDAHSPAQVLHFRISTAYRGALAPLPDRATVPPEEISEQWRGYVASLDEAADDRRRQLGAELVDEPPQWAVETLGPVPEEAAERALWEYRAGVAAGYREATGWDHRAEPIGPAPGLSSTERRAAWHDAWAALGRPEATAEEQDLSVGALRNRVRAWELEQAWQPADVYEESRDTGQQAARHRQEAALLDAQAEAAGDVDEATRLREDAAQRRAMAETLVEVDADLERVAEARVDWVMETAVTRELAERAEAELAMRGHPVGDEPDRVTAEEWLAEHERAMTAEDPHRAVTERDLADDVDQERGAAPEPVERVEIADTALAGAAAGGNPSVERHGDEAAADGHDRPAVAEEPAGHDDQLPAPGDQAEEAAEPERPAGVPTPVEVDAAVAAAEHAADEIAQRQAAEDARRQDEAARLADEAEASREQHYREQAQAELERQRQQELEQGPVLER